MKSVRITRAFSRVICRIPSANASIKPFPLDSINLASIPMENTRNFCIVAHVDHGKSTLADRLLERAGLVKGDVPQVLDALVVERERGVTVKSHCATLGFEIDGVPHLLNLVDTPGHADFSHEVARSLCAVEGAILLVDASQGIQAQTMAHWHLIDKHDLCVVPVLNKIDLPHADPVKVSEDVSETFKLPIGSVLSVSAKTGEGVDGVIQSLVDELLPPEGDRNAPLRVRMK